MRLSVIIPALNEAENIGGAVKSALTSDNSPPPLSPPPEIIVVDGGSADGTVETARSLGARVLQCSPGRARQMNAGAAAAKGDALLFLHADTVLPEGYAGQVMEALGGGAVAGAFELKIDGAARSLRLIERLANWRSRAFGLPYGDQAIFVRADAFRAAGGFPEMPIMEDFELMYRLRKRGHIVIASVPALTSARRWKRRGVLRTTLINQLMILGYLAGVSPERIARWYR